MGKGTDVSTLRYTNLSTTESFQFVFHCGLCGKGIASLCYAFDVRGFVKPLGKGARALLWIQQHDEAYARARNEAGFEFNVCSLCGSRVCSDCFRLSRKGTTGRCLTCLKKKYNAGLYLSKTANSDTSEGGENPMLSSVTRRYIDLSTHEFFEFAFFCDRCGNEWRSDRYCFDKRGFEYPIDERIREMLWNRQHDEAYERANREAGVRFNRCAVCGSRVCDDCLFSVSPATPAPTATAAPSTDPAPGATAVSSTDPASGATAAPSSDPASGATKRSSGTVNDGYCCMNCEREASASNTE